MSDNNTEQAKIDLTGHFPVMLSETLKILDPKDSKTYLDCTFGGGGHSKAILDSANCSLVAIDQDTRAIDTADLFKEVYEERFSFYSLNFCDLDKTQNSYDGILMDLGVSSFQLDIAERGFSFMRDGDTDMRMDTRADKSALDILENASYEYLVEILQAYGQEPRSKQVARAIIDARGTGKLERTGTLAELIGANASWDKGRKKHPATRAFQALRIATNDEIGVLEQALPKAFDALKSGGVLAIITFHSLEDRIVKRFFKSMAGVAIDRRDNSFSQDRVKRAEILTRKATTASESELELNKRSRSAKLRAIRKL